MAFYKAGYADGGFERGVRDAVTAILASPHFLYRAESGNAVGGARTLSDLELASRLSFFLWSSLPDEELLDLATRRVSVNPTCWPNRCAACLPTRGQSHWSMILHFNGST